MIGLEEKIFSIISHFHLLGCLIIILWIQLRLYSPSLYIPGDFHSNIILKEPVAEGKYNVTFSQSVEGVEVEKLNIITLNFNSYKNNQRKNLRQNGLIFYKGDKEETELPSCSGKLYVNPSLLKLKRTPKETPPLPPFTSGQPPIYRLESSSQLPIPVILTSLGRSGSSSTWQVMSRLTGHCF